VRGLAVFCLVVLLAGCGSGNNEAEQAKPRAQQARGKCLPPVRGFQLCGRPTQRTTPALPSTIVHGDTLVAKAIGRAGHWRKLFVSPDGETLLAEWSAECEIPIAFFVPARGGEPRAVTGERDWTTSPDSEAFGWEGARAVVGIPRIGETVSDRPGVYLIDPKTYERTFVRPLKGARGC
jgi:hypothetical protein